MLFEIMASTLFCISREALFNVTVPFTMSSAKRLTLFSSTFPFRIALERSLSATVLLLAADDTEGRSRRNKSRSICAIDSFRDVSESRDDTESFDVERRRTLSVGPFVGSGFEGS